MNILAKLGLTTWAEPVSTPDVIPNDQALRAMTASRDDWRASSIERASRIADLTAEIASLRHDAQKWRNKLARDRTARKGAEK